PPGSRRGRCTRCPPPGRRGARAARRRPRRPPSRTGRSTGTRGRSSRCAGRRSGPRRACSRPCSAPAARASTPLTTATARVYNAAAAMGRQRRRARRSARSVWARSASEVAALAATALVGVLAALGWLADRVALTRVLERARVYEPTVHEAAAAFGVDVEVLMGVGAAESAFYPRDSAGGGRGLFQITAPPAEAVAEVRRRLGVAELDPLNQRHNAFAAAATLRRYLDEMRGDLFLGLLAYNIGPRNGGLRAIMEQYGARDFATIQPYLNTLPRDYPIRVLSAALAYRLWR